MSDIEENIEASTSGAVVTATAAAASSPPPIQSRKKKRQVKRNTVEEPAITAAAATDTNNTNDVNDNDDNQSTSNDFAYLLNISNANAQEKVESVLRSIIENDDCLDVGIRELLKLYSIDTNACLTLVSINSKFIFRISANDYEQIINYLWIGYSTALRLNKTLNASLAICDPLPFTKFYIDLDCDICHQNARHPIDSYRSHFENAQVNGRAAVLEIVREVQSFFPQKLDFVVATKSRRPWCGIHLYFMINLDIIMRKLIFNHLIRLQFKVHKIDVTHNGILPFCRNYDLFFNSMFQPITADENLTKKISYIDVWRSYPTHCYLESMTAEELAESLSSNNTDEIEPPPSKRLCKGINSTLEVHLMANSNLVNTLYFSLERGIQCKPEETDTYRELINNNPSFTHLNLQNSNSSNLEISINDINIFTKFAQHSTTSQIISLTKIEEYYQQVVPVAKINYTPQLTYDADDELANLPSLVHCARESKPKRKIRSAPAKLNLRNTTLRPDFGVEEEEQIQNCRDYVEITNRNIQVLDSILSDETITVDVMVDVFQKVFTSDDLSLYDIVISMCALNDQIPIELIQLCNVDILERSGGGVGGGGGEDEPQPVINNQRGKKSKKPPARPSNHSVREHFDAHLAVIYNFFKDLICHAILRNHTLAILSFVQQNCSVNSKILLKIFIQILCTEWASLNPEKDVSLQVSIRKSMKLILGLYDCDESYAHENLVKSFDGNEMHFAAWNFKPNQGISDMYAIISARLQSMQINNTTSQFRYYFTENILSLRTVGDRIQFFNGKYREIVEPESFSKKFNSIEQTASYVEHQAKICSYQCFAYYSSIGIVHPTLRVTERAGPFLLNKIYRDFGKNIEDSLIYPNRQSYIFMRDVYFKANPFIQQMRQNIIGFVLLSPVVNTNVEPIHIHFKSLINPVISTVNVVITDLSNIYSMNWPSNFIKELQFQTTQHTLFGRMWNCWLSFMMTLHRNYQFTSDAVRSDPMRVLINLFGANEYQGYRPTVSIDHSTVQFKDAINNNSSSSSNDQNQFSIEADIYNNPADGLSLLPNGEALFHHRVKKIIDRKKNEYIHTWDANSIENTCLSNTFTLSTHYETESQKILTQVVFAECFMSAQFNFDAPPPLNFRGVSPSFEQIPSDFIKFCFILFSWLVRMGDTHRYAKVPFMQKIINCRSEIYESMNNCILKYFNIGYINKSAQNHTDIFREYCESIELDYSKLELPDLNEIPSFNYLFEDDKTEKFYIAEDQLTSDNKKAVYTAISDLIVFSNYDRDCFVDLCKVVAGLEFPSNYLKRMNMFFGRSSGGKNVFLDKLKHTFNCCDKIKLSNKHYGEISADFNPNVSLLGTSLLVNLDEPPSMMKVSEIKNDVNIFDITTRKIQGHESERYQITAKMFITSNEMVGPTTADEGWFKRLMIFPVRHSFCQLKSKIFRSGAQAGDATSSESSEYLVVQVLCNCYPDSGNAPNIIAGLTITSFVLFRRLFFYKSIMPTSFAISDSAKRQIYSYMMQHSPLFEFLNTTVITPSEQYMDSTTLHDFIKNWGSLYRKPNITQLYKDIKTFLIPYMAGNVYYARMEIRTRNNRL